MHWQTSRCPCTWSCWALKNFLTIQSGVAPLYRLVLYCLLVVRPRQLIHVLQPSFSFLVSHNSAIGTVSAWSSYTSYFTHTERKLEASQCCGHNKHVWCSVHLACERAHNSCMTVEYLQAHSAPACRSSHIRTGYVSTPRFSCRPTFWCSPVAFYTECLIRQTAQKL